MTDTDLILDLLHARVPWLTLYDGEVPIGTHADEPHAILWPSTPTPTRRRITGQAHAHLRFASLVCVSNNGPGAVHVAEQALQALDGHRLPGCSPIITGTSAPIRDPDMAAGYVWSVTVTIAYYSRRSHA